MLNMSQLTGDVDGTSWSLWEDLNQKTVRTETDTVMFVDIEIVATVTT